MRPRWLDLYDSNGREINLSETRILRITRYDAGQQKIISTNEEVELLSNLL